MIPTQEHQAVTIKLLKNQGQSKNSGAEFGAEFGAIVSADCR